MMQFNWFSIFCFCLGWERGKDFYFPLLEYEPECLIENSEFNIAASIQENIFKRFFFSVLLLAICNTYKLETQPFFL